MNKMVLLIVLVVVAIVFWIFALTKKPAYIKYQEEERRLELEVIGVGIEMRGGVFLTKYS